MQIGIHHHCISCRIGILPYEREIDQNIYIDVKVKLRDWKKNYDIGETVCYVEIADLCTELAQKNSYGLLEQMVEELMDELFIRFPISYGWIRIKKPQAIPSAEYAFVELDRNEKE
jgi:FolB domain-containing protein